jgi:hypothetical protein
MHISEHEQARAALAGLRDHLADAALVADPITDGLVERGCGHVGRERSAGHVCPLGGG